MSETEIDRAAMSISSFDQNGVNRIDFDEVADDSVDATEVWKPKRSRRWGEVAMDLTENVDWSMLSYTIRNLNRPSPFGAEKTLLSRIDQDDNETINANEAKQLMLVSPDVRLRVAFGTGGDGSIEIESLSRRIESRFLSLGPEIRRIAILPIQGSRADVRHTSVIRSTGGYNGCTVCRRRFCGSSGVDFCQTQNKTGSNEFLSKRWNCLQSVDASFLTANAEPTRGCDVPWMH